MINIIDWPNSYIVRQTIKKFIYLTLKILQDTVIQ